MAKYLIISNDHFKAFVEVLRVKEGDDGKVLEHEIAEVEIDFAGGEKTRLVGQSAWHFITAINQAMGG